MDALIPFLAFVGGVAAVAAKAWLDYILERRRERAQLRSAARLIANEFSGIAVHGQTIEAHGRWQEFEEWGFDHDAWRENKALLSANLSYLDWITIASGYRSVRTYESFPEWAREENAAPWPMLAHGQVLFLSLYRRDFVRAQGALSEAARTGHSARRSVRGRFREAFRWRGTPGRSASTEATKEPTPLATMVGADKLDELDETEP